MSTSKLSKHHPADKADRTGSGNGWEKVGVVGVDAGLLWLGDPCYILDKDGSRRCGWCLWSQMMAR